MRTGPNRQVLSALAALQGDASFQLVLKWLEVNREQLRDEAVEQRDEVLMRWAQGGSQTLDSLLRYFKEAPRLLHKFN